jgi:hypothetical protein
MTMLTLLRDRDFYDDPSRLKDFLAEQLFNGRLALFLGAGVSTRFELPTWISLLERLAAQAGIALPDELGPEDAAEWLLTTCFGNDRLAFARAVHLALFQGCDASFASLRQSDLLAALGALVMTSSRGSAGVVTFNFDDILETYLRLHGFDVASIASAPAWNSRTDVKVYHPHGLLPIGHPEASTPVVFTRKDFDAIVGKNDVVWRQVLLGVSRSSTCLFIGLSGNDSNLTSLLDETNTSHPARLRGDIFWGVRFSANASDPRRMTWENRGVFQQVVASHDELPTWLFEIAQKAAALRAAQ